VSSVTAPTYTNSTTPTFSLYFANNYEPVPSGAVFSCDSGKNWSAPVATSGSSSPVTTSSFNITNGSTGCTSSEGSKTFYVRYKNSCGTSQNYGSVTTNYDITGPSWSVQPTATATSTSVITEYAGTLTDGSGIGGPYDYYYTAFTSSDCTGSYVTPGWQTATSWPMGSLNANTQYSWKVGARDGLDNYGTESTCALNTL